MGYLVQRFITEPHDVYHKQSGLPALDGQVHETQST